MRSTGLLRGRAQRRRAFAATGLLVLALAGRRVALCAEPDAAAGRLGISAEELVRMQSEVQKGSIDADELKKICAGVAAKHLSRDDIDSVAAELGLAQDQAAQLQQCSGATAPEQKAGAANAIANEASAGAPAPPAPGLSPIERSFEEVDGPAARIANPGPQNLEQFGYSLFSSPVSTFAPVANVPVSPDYVLGPDDELKVLMWGRVNSTLSLKVERDGSVLIPHLGPIQIAGLTFAQAKNLIESRSSQITGVQTDVTMGQIRTIQVFVIGKVDHPGLYTMSALSHVSNALVAAGGISKVGSLRRIELRRGNQVIRTIDLYDLLLHGNAASDVGLQARDVIFVPVIGPVVAVAGDVKASAIYELKGGEDLVVVLAMAGGIGAFGYQQRLQVERIENHQRRVALDVEAAQLTVGTFEVADGDLVKIFRVLPRQENTVRLRGNVNRPGAYQWFEGMRVADLVREGEGVADHTYFDYALIERLEGPSRAVHFLPVDLAAALYDHSSADIELAPRDELTIYSESELQDLPMVSIRGAVRKPGSYRLTRGMRVSDLIYQAGGLPDNAYQERAQLAHVRVLNGSTAHYLYEDIDLRAALSGRDDRGLERGDELLIQQASNWHELWSIAVAGEVARPGPYIIRDGERLASVLERSGGLRSDAYLPASVFVRKSVKQAEDEQLKKSRQHLQQEVAQLSATPLKPGQEQKDRDAGLAQIQGLLADAQSQQAVGRVVLHLTSMHSLANSSDNLVLQDADTLTIPKLPATVNVLGQVYNPAAIVFQRDLTVADYLQQAGGPSEGADKEHILVVKADGSMVSDESIRSSGRGMLFPLLPAISRGLSGMQLQPGDTVFVPPKLEYVDSLKYATEITQILSNTAMALSVIGILGTHL